VVDSLSSEKKLQFFSTVYAALSDLGHRDPATAARAMAALRLLLIDAVGEERQRELIGEWNELLSRRPIDEPL
jgi:hypothetical protein